MLSNYYTLVHIVQDIQQAVRGWDLTEACTQNPNELVIACSHAGEERFIVISCEPSSNYCYLTDKFSRARKNTMELFKPLYNSKITDVIIHPYDREIVITTEGNYCITIHLYGPKANIFLIDANDHVHESFLQPKENVGKQIQRSTTVGKEVPASSEAFLTSIRAEQSISMDVLLKKYLPLFGGNLVKELLFRANVELHRHSAELTLEEAERIHKTAIMLDHELRAPCKPCIYFENDTPLQFSLIPMQCMSGSREERCENLSTGIRNFLRLMRTRKKYIGEKLPVAHFLKLAMERSDRTIEKIKEDINTFDRSAHYETIGKLIMSYLDQIEKGNRQVELMNMFSEQRELITCTLDPALSPVQNAERYFDKAKRSRRSIDEKIDRMRQEELRHKTLLRLRTELERSQSMDKLEDFFEQYRAELAKVGFKVPTTSNGKEVQRIPFRVFTVAGGFAVWAGKSSQNNDLLTMKYAKPNDLWFHARGSGGSHVVLRIGSGKGEPTKQAIEQAAAIAAYYSKMKNAKNVPVAMVEKKYIRKPKGANPGTVMLEREKVIFVNPKLPEGGKE
jgi:predicted ribosome quality control (RQC) complex YloA/Tae2 family protein